MDIVINCQVMYHKKNMICCESTVTDKKQQRRKEIQKTQNIQDFQLNYTSFFSSSMLYLLNHFLPFFYLCLSLTLSISLPSFLQHFSLPLPNLFLIIVASSIFQSIFSSDTNAYKEGLISAYSGYLKSRHFFKIDAMTRNKWKTKPDLIYLIQD